MQSWLEVDGAGRDFLVRSGEGVVTAVAAVDGEGASGLLRVDITCDRPTGGSRAVRYTAHPLVACDSPFAALAQQAAEESWSITWVVEWHRLPHIPAQLPVMSLNLRSDATATLVSMERILLPEDVDVEVPDHIPASWGA